MLLNNVMLLAHRQPVSIAINYGKITGIAKYNTPAGEGNDSLQFNEAIAFPGLINSHDHLDFNCFSPLGKKKYTNYTEWGRHIHTHHKADITKVLTIPQQLRASWGMYKNLLAGVTTVVNHGPVLTIQDPLINIYQEPQNLHSVQFQKKWKWRLNNPLLKNKACVIHTGEGIDQKASEEIASLLRWNLLNRKLIGVHGVAMNAEQAKQFWGLVWCPESNSVLLDHHADIAAFKTITKLVFGTDSTLTGDWNIWQHMRLARKLQVVNDAELFSMLTQSPAWLWELNTGEIQPGRDADLVIAKTATGQADWDNFYAIDPADILLVVHKGNVRLFDEALMPQLKNSAAGNKSFHPVDINGAVKFVEGNVPALMDAIRKYNPDIVFPVNNQAVAHTV